MSAVAEVVDMRRPRRLRRERTERIVDFVAAEIPMGTESLRGVMQRSVAIMARQIQSTFESFPIMIYDLEDTRANPRKGSDPFLEIRFRLVH